MRGANAGRKRGGHGAPTPSNTVDTQRRGAENRCPSRPLPVGCTVRKNLFGADPAVAACAAANCTSSVPGSLVQPLPQLL